jgi:FkbM family methyltransferase
MLENKEGFWDIGANIGLHSLAVKRKMPDVKVYSFEPKPKTIGLLYDNARLNNPDIEICEFPLYSECSMLNLQISEGNAGMTTLVPWEEATYKSKIQCHTLTGNYLVKNGFQILSVIKTDTEGSELSALKRCSDFLWDPILKSSISEGEPV